MHILHRYHLPTAIAVMIVSCGTLCAQTDSATSRVVPRVRSQRQWLIPHIGGYVRTPFGFTLEVGARGGIDILRNIVTLTGELGFMLPISDENDSGGLIGIHALRLEVTPLPIGFMQRVALHAERRFFDHRRLNMRDYGFGMIYRCDDFPATTHVLFVDATFVVLKDKFVTLPFIGVGVMVWL